jgi:hypothetical protein
MATTIEKVGSRLYFANSPFAAKDAIKRLGGHWDADRRQWWIGAAKSAEAAALVAELNGAASAPAGPPAKEDPHQIRLTGKGRYKGREYFAGAITHDGSRVRLLTLPDESGNYLDFWAPCAEVEQTKTYSPRQKWDGRRGNGTVTVYTTLGSIADFVRDQRAAEKSGLPACAACDMPE